MIVLCNTHACIVRLPETLSEDKRGFQDEAQRPRKVVHKAPQSVNTCEAGRIAFFPVSTLCIQEVGLKSCIGVQWGYRCTVYVVCSPSLSVRTPPQPVCFRRVCEKRRRGVGDCICLSSW